MKHRQKIMMTHFKLRPYQKEIVEKLDNLETGKYLIHLSTGLGKTVIFSQLKRFGKVLILSHRDELVRQPIKYFDCKVGIEKGISHVSYYNNEVVSASVQTMVKRLTNYSKD